MGDFTIGVNYSQTAIASFGNHGSAILQPLDSVDFDVFFVFWNFFGLVGPKFFASFVHFGHAVTSHRQQKAVFSKLVDVVYFGTQGKMPIGLAVLHHANNGSFVGTKNLAALGGQVFPRIVGLGQYGGTSCC